MSLFSDNNRRSDDPFGLNAERRIIDSKVREIFTPHKPINTLGHFFGRQEEVRRLVSQMNTPGQHSLLFGDRGIGKSSLATITSEVLLGRMTQGKVFTKRCGRSDTFETIVAPLLKHFGVLDVPDEVAIQSSTSREATLRLPYVDAKNTSSNQLVEKWKKEHDFSPSVVAELLRKRHGILIVDEADAISVINDRYKLAEFVKHLSDCNSSVRLLIVGIASTGSDLLAAHPSVGRCLKETKLEKMLDDEIRKIVVEGAKNAKLVFERPVIDEIVSLSAGYPHFTHLLCLKAAEEVIGNDQNVVTPEVLRRAMASSIQDVEGALKDSFDKATRSNSTDMYKLLLLAAAQLPQREFTAEQWREAYRALTGNEIKQQGVNTYLDRLVTDEDTAVLKRVARGMYCFIDPRMPSFVRIEAGQRTAAG